MYSFGDLSKIERIAVLCRGQSVSHIAKCNDFDSCYIVGQFDGTLKVLGSYLLGKNIVQVINKSTTKISKKIHDKYNVNDIQCNFDGWLHRPPSSGRMDLYNKIKKQNKWAQVHLAPPGIRERRPCDKKGLPMKWQTTGIYAVDLAAFWQPKEIWIFGLDFYASPYFKKEKIHAGLKKNKLRKKAMLHNFKKIVERDTDISFSLFTKCKDIKSNGSNLLVKYV